MLDAFLRLLVDIGKGWDQMLLDSIGSPALEASSVQEACLEHTNASKLPLFSVWKTPGVFVWISTSASRGFAVLGALLGVALELLTCLDQVGKS